MQVGIDIESTPCQRGAAWKKASGEILKYNRILAVMYSKREMITFNNGY